MIFGCSPCQRLGVTRALRRKAVHPFKVLRRTTSKLCESADGVLSSLQEDGVVDLDGATVAVGGFGPTGLPETWIDALCRHATAQNLTVVSLDVGTDDRGVGRLIRAGKVRRVVAAYVGENDRFAERYFGGQLRVELTPMGTIAQRLRAAGMGIPAFYVPAGAGTLYGRGGLPLRFEADGSRQADLYAPPRPHVTLDDGKEYLLERAIRPDLGLVKARVADVKGNLRFGGTARNSNPDVAVAAKVTLVEAQGIVEAGHADMGPDRVHLPGIYVHGLIRATIDERAIECLCLADDGKNAPPDKRTRIARRAAQEFRHGMYVNLGIGLPTLCANYISDDDDDDDIVVQSENGLLGVGPYPATADEASPDWTNAGKQTVTARPGAAVFGSSESFGMIRGGRVDVTVLGGLQCSRHGDLASWMVPGKLVKVSGGHALGTRESA